MFKTLSFLSFILFFSTTGNTTGLPDEGDWILFRILPASEWKPVPMEYIRITAGPSERVNGKMAGWWQMEAFREERLEYAIQALSDRVPMAAEDGDIGTVYRYLFQDRTGPALEYVNARSGLAQLPLYGFRDGLIPTPRSLKNRVGPFLATGNYLGQPLTAQGHGSKGEWMEMGEITHLAMDDELMVGTFRWMKDDGTGPLPDGEYTYVELTPEDYERMIAAGFNYFPVNPVHLGNVLNRNVFFILHYGVRKRDYPNLLYRSNFLGTQMFVDEPAARMDSLECRTVYDAVNLLRTRNHTYYNEMGGARDGIVQMAARRGYTLGDWHPIQHTVRLGDTYHETAFDQMLGGAVMFFQEGRYQLDEFNRDLERILGPGTELDLEQALRSGFAFMRGAARCFHDTWAVAIYGQCDYSIAHDAVYLAYDMGVDFIGFWTSDHDHHLPFERQIETARAIREYQRARPVRDTKALLRAARVAVAVPEGYQGTGEMMWWANQFNHHRLNEFGVPYGDVVAEYWSHIYQLARDGVEFDCVVDIPEIVNRAGYERVIRIRPDGTSDVPPPNLPVKPVQAAIRDVSSEAFSVRSLEGPTAVVRKVVPDEIVVDGDLADWEDADWFDLALRLNREEREDGEIDSWDFSAKAAFRYDGDSIYVAVLVRDATHSAPFDGDFIWRNDSVQIGFDPLLNGGSLGQYRFDDAEIGFSLVGGKPYAHAWHQRFTRCIGPLVGANLAIVRDGEETRYEARIPFSCLRPLSPNLFGETGMCIVVNDSDGFSRKGTLAWTSGLADGKYPDRWGILKFEDVDRTDSPTPAVFFRPLKTVGTPGEGALFEMETWSPSDVHTTLILRIRSGAERMAPIALPVTIRSGNGVQNVYLETSSLAASGYHAEFTVLHEGTTVMEQELRFLVVR